MAHVSLITLGVEDLDRASAFYEALGWRRSVASVSGVVTFLQGETVVLSLFGRDDLARDATVDFTNAGHRDVVLAMNVEDEATVDAVLSSAAQAGGDVLKEARRADWGGYSGYFADPDGHLWEVAHNPHFPLLDDGRVLLPGD